MTAETTTRRGLHSTLFTDENPFSEREPAPKVSTRGGGLHWYAVTLRDWAMGAQSRSRAYWMPPRFLTDPPSSIAAMTAYAQRAGWTGSTTGLFRKLGQLWFYAVALPTAITTRYIGWIAERPGRWILAVGVYQLFIRSVPGVAITEHVIRPLLAAAASVFLP